MKALIRVLKEQFLSLPLIIRLAAYETKSKYQMNYLGVLWQFLNPLIQMLAYWFVFGIGIRKSSEMVTGVGEVPFIIWMLAGLIPWFLSVRRFLTVQTVFISESTWWPNEFSNQLSSVSGDRG